MEETKYESPIYYIDNNSKIDVLVIAGIHGNEIAGIKAADRMINKKIKGANFTIIPRANIEAVNLGVRNPYYMSDLNRAFPGKVHGTDTEELAYFIYEFINDIKPDLIFDLHEWEKSHDEDPSLNSYGIIVNSNDLDFWKIIDKIYNEHISTYNSKVMVEAGDLSGTLGKEILEGTGINVVTIESNLNDEIEFRVGFYLEIIESIIKNYRMDEH